MKNNSLFCFLICVSAITSWSFAQTTPKTEHPTINTNYNSLSDQDKLKDLLSVLDGTYQLRISNPDYAPLFTLEILTIVNDNRLQSLSQVIEIDEYTTLFLPSVDYLESESFHPLETILYQTGPIQATDDN